MQNYPTQSQVTQSVFPFDVGVITFERSTLLISREMHCMLNAMELLEELNTWRGGGGGNFHWQRTLVFQRQCSF
jgi:hypothetical protein